MEEVAADKVPPAPRIIHFVWAGGKGSMPPKNMRVVMQWLLKNPEFTIYLWIDEKTCGLIKDTLDYYAEEFRCIYEKLTEIDSYNEPFVTHENNEKETIIPGKIIIKDIERNGLRNKWVSYFIGLASPNYGASSDLIRCPALSLGGAYFDTDVGPGSTHLGELSIFNEFGSHRILLDDFAQVRELTNEQMQARFDLENFALEQAVGNDTFGCTEKNPLMDCFFNFSVARLIEISKDKNGRFALCYGFRDIKYLTIYATGPKSTRDCIALYPYTLHNKTLRGGFDVIIDPRGKSILFKPKGPIVEISPIRYPGSDPVVSFSPEHNWLKKKINHFEPAELKKTVKDTMLFECEHFKIVRVDDHIEDLIKHSADFDKSEQLNADMAFKFILECFPRNELFSPEILLQITGKFEISSCSFKGSLPIIPKDAQKIVACMSYWGDFCGYFTQQNDIEEDSGYIEELNKYFKKVKNTTFPTTLSEFLENINASIDSFEVYCQPELPFFAPRIASVIRDQVFGYLKKYMNFVLSVISVMPEKIFSSSEGSRLEELRKKIILMMSRFEPKKAQSGTIESPKITKFL
jgi:hypothetical protein